MRVIVAAVVAAFPLGALGAEDVGTLQQQIDALKREVSQLRTQENSLVHLSGYAAVGYTDQRKASNGSFDTVSFNPIFQYQYKNLVFFKAELETAVEPDGSTEVMLEYADFNLFVNDYVTAFGGKFLSPVGYFFQNLHPAWINKFASRPPGFGGEGSAAPESDVGIGLRGGFPLGGAAKANYAFYVGNGPRLELNAAGDEIEAIEAEGATSNPSGSKLFGGRIGVLPIPSLEIGISGGTSKVAVVDSTSGLVEDKRDYRVAGADAGWRFRGLDLRGEYIKQRVGDLATSVAPQGGTWKTWYAQAAYRLPGTNWEPVLRYGDFKSPHADQKLEQWGVGLNYWFAPSAVVKVGYEVNKGEAGTANDENRFLLQFAFGF